MKVIYIAVLHRVEMVQKAESQNSWLLSSCAPFYISIAEISLKSHSFQLKEPGTQGRKINFVNSKNLALISKA